jgi:chorismate mutase / prephenate dehydratase
MSTIPKIAALGPAGTNGHEAALIASKRLYGDMQTEIVFYPRNQDVLQMVAEQKIYGVVPVENSGEGLVGEVVKGFWMEESKRGPGRRLYAIGEIHLSIEHCLLSHWDLEKIDHVMEVISHPQALGQCSGNLDKLRIEKRIPEKSTALAAQRISKSPNLKTSAALASRFAGQIYGLRTLRENMEDVAGNTTRFHIIGPDIFEETGEDRTAMMFRVKNEPKALQNALWAIGLLGVNMSSIHSIPLGVPGRYAFYCEFDTHIRSTAGKQIEACLPFVTERVFVLGSYPQSAPEKGGAA